jgi:hypothetical protein
MVMEKISLSLLINELISLNLRPSKLTFKIPVYMKTSSKVSYKTSINDHNYLPVHLFARHH